MTRAQWIEEARRRLTSVPEGEPLLADDFDWFIGTLLPRRWVWEDAPGDPGLGSIVALRHVGARNGPALEATFRDGTKVLAGWRKAAEIPSHEALVRAAMRGEIDSQARRLRAPGHHVHHEGEAFVEIAEKWLAGRSAKAIRISSSGDGRGYLLDDRNLAAEWAEFHRARASLVRLSHAEHGAAHGRVSSDDADGEK